ncbi:MAG: PAS-domain containing protein [Brevirhabdus sp.]
MPGTVLDLLPIAGLLLASVSGALAVVWLLDRIWHAPPTPNSLPALFDPKAPGVRFLLDGRNVLMASRDGQAILAARPRDQDPWDRVMELAETRFPGIEEKLETLSPTNPVTMQGKDSDEGGTFLAEMQMGLISLSFDEACFHQNLIRVDPAILNADAARIDEYHAVLSTSPAPIWIETDEGEVRWANDAYAALVRRIDPDAAVTWPFARVFNLCPETDSLPRRLCAGKTDGPDEEWFMCHAHKTQRNELICHALPATETVRAEKALNHFVATLTDTFAHLSTGLAVFDKDRRLTLFNPALVEITGLDPTWATGRPTLAAVLDRLRETRMVPEPRDYVAWRNQMVRLEQQARDGSYAEDWPLPDGRTLRVTGRPHPRGAVALLIEDVTPLMSQTRRHRAELELSHAILDGLQEAVVVFSRQGTVLTANTAYGKLWGHDPNASLEELSIIDCTRLWSSECAPSPAWGDLRDFVHSQSRRSEWTAVFSRLDGSTLHGRFQSLPGGGTLVSFSPEHAEEPANAGARHSSSMARSA